MLRQHLLHTTLVHWDASLRALGADTLAQLLTHEPEAAAPYVDALLRRVGSMDHEAVHGALLALGGLAPCLAPPLQRDVVDAAASVSPALFPTPGGAAVLEAACALVAAVPGASAGGGAAALQRLLSTASARPELRVQVAAVDAWRACRDEPALGPAYIDDVLRRWATLRVEEQQTGARALGALALRGTESAALLCGVLDPASDLYGADVEVRVQAAHALAQLPVTPGAVAALCAGLQDHTVDQRGDVGARVRVASLQSLAAVLRDPGVADDVVARACVCAGGLVLERMDVVRRAACGVLGMLCARAPMPCAAAWRAALGAARDAATPADEFAALMPLLALAPFRPPLLETLVRTIGSRSETSARAAGPALVHWVLRADDVDAITIFDWLAARIARHARDNRVVVPALQTLELLVSWDVHLERDVAARYVAL